MRGVDELRALEVDVDTRIGLDAWEAAHACEDFFTFDVVANLMRVAYTRGYDHAAFDQELSLYRDHPVPA